MSELEASYHIIYHGEEILAKEDEDVYYGKDYEYSDRVAALYEVIQQYDAVDECKPFCFYGNNEECKKLFVGEEYGKCKEQAEVEIIVGGKAENKACGNTADDSREVEYVELEGAPFVFQRRTHEPVEIKYDRYQ